MLQKGESEKHRRIKLLLVNSFKNKKWDVKHIDGENDQTELVINNNNVGDGENKRPDIDAKDEIAKRIIRGETKIGDGDFDSEHSITQYKLFSNRKLDGIKSWLIIGVPHGERETMEQILDTEIDSEDRKNIAVWEYED